ncbi:bifunctional glycerol-3-phosphate/glycerone-phosphate O-acyltransferase SCT1 KNAG_0C02930 [Huiozyma naganishii CBS 8797]|uniref:Phospholipid/glycerol acyltransferase domain-containing protein n=1 Tax=Huiozyma naganishii (strain ATCC MYA-139 / BCRC 22969 / CBS 8797 / KCTC 17520 / NBRC 10181 / NCYC 3082 / Yp74L-3) TaxID=1071383 RepID=J7S4P8_HUIN7|nr:hypothetical protein KNAG_0C02930 [Kazachstania naganishii CBS 8797]CCK69404.1 hypothetical protein KNAG_0C02930 [Kazachstania naganishii CBS 8797]
MESPLSDKHKRLQAQGGIGKGQPSSSGTHTATGVPSTKSAGLAPHMRSNGQFKYEEPPQWRMWTYDLLCGCSRIFPLLFREIRPRSAFKIPKEGPVIFVAAPHANQFVDPVILMDQVKQTVNRRISFLIAESSLKMLSVGFLARCVMAIGVVRPQDNLKYVDGKIKLDSENPKHIIGVGTKFTRDCEPGGLIAGPKSAMGNVAIQSVESDTSLYIRKEFKGTHKPEIKNLLAKGTPYKYAAKVDQSLVYEKVFEHLAHNGCIGIFPEGGSHDRTDLLPLKAGVAIMALGCMDAHRGTNVKIVPCGMNYFHPHKFRSRAVVEFGEPIEIPKELVDRYHNPETNREAVKELLDTITEGLKAVTVTCGDYETLIVVQAMRRLYATQFNGQLPLPMVVEMNRRLVKGYETYKDDPKMIQLTEDILKYNAHLRHFSIPDHLVETAKVNLVKNTWLLAYRSVRIIISFTLALPGLLLFSPVFLLAKRISREKARTALAKSTVKIKANDVIATWKILIAMGFAPLLYIFWSALITYYFRDRSQHRWFIFLASYIASVVVTYSALVVGDIGMDIVKSLRPLYVSITSPNGLKDLQKERRSLTIRIVNIVDQFGSKLFPGFESHSFVSEMNDKFKIDRENEEQAEQQQNAGLLKPRKRHISGKEMEDLLPNTSVPEGADAAEQERHDSDAISLVNSDNSLSNIPIFSTLSGLKSESSVTSATTTGTSASDLNESDEIEEIAVKGGSNAIASRVADAIIRKRNAANYGETDDTFDK